MTIKYKISNYNKIKIILRIRISGIFLNLKINNLIIIILII